MFLAVFMFSGVAYASFYWKTEYLSKDAVTELDVSYASQNQISTYKFKDGAVTCYVSFVKETSQRSGTVPANPTMSCVK